MWIYSHIIYLAVTNRKRVTQVIINMFYCVQSVILSSMCDTVSEMTGRLNQRLLFQTCSHNTQYTVSVMWRHSFNVPQNTCIFKILSLTQFNSKFATQWSLKRPPQSRRYSSVMISASVCLQVWLLAVHCWVSIWSSGHDYTVGR